MSGVGLERELRHDVVRDLHTGGVRVEIESCGDGQAGCGGRCADEADDRVAVPLAVLFVSVAVAQS
jgi:hypothetical protein